MCRGVTVRNLNQILWGSEGFGEARKIRFRFRRLRNKPRNEINFYYSTFIWLAGLFPPFSQNMAVFFLRPQKHPKTAKRMYLKLHPLNLILLKMPRTRMNPYILELMVPILLIQRILAKYPQLNKQALAMLSLSSP